MRRNQKELQKKVDEFNIKYPVGTDVYLTKDNGEIMQTKVKYPASVMGNHSAIGWFENVIGCYSLDRIK
ncbi:MAG TPA: hypothetical protein VI146_06010 [Nitrososphaeraceae archaeon]